MNNNNMLVKDGKLNFGNYAVTEKIKINDFEHMGNVYSLRAHDQVTRLEKNGELLLETVPGSAIFDFVFDEKGCAFVIESNTGVQVTLGLAPETAYDLAIFDAKGAETHEEIETNRSGKLSFGVELSDAGKRVALCKLG